MKVYGTTEAAEYLGFKVSRFKYHIYQRNIIPDAKVGHTLIFREDTLVDFRNRFETNPHCVPDPAPMPEEPMPGQSLR